MSFSPKQIGELNAIIADMLSIEDEVRNPKEQHALFTIATMLGLLVENPALGSVAICALAKQWKVKPRREAGDGLFNGSLPSTGGRK